MLNAMNLSRIFFLHTLLNGEKDEWYYFHTSVENAIRN